MDGGAWWAAVHGVTEGQTRLSNFTFTFHFHWRRKWQPTPVFLPGESQGWGSLVGCHLWGRRESDTTEAAVAGISLLSKVSPKQGYVQPRLTEMTAIVQTLDLTEAHSGWWSGFSWGPSTIGRGIGEPHHAEGMGLQVPCPLDPCSKSVKLHLLLDWLPRWVAHGVIQIPTSTQIIRVISLTEMCHKVMLLCNLHPNQTVVLLWGAECPL